MTSAHYSEDEQLWNVALKTRDGKQENIKVSAIVTAVGQLNRPKFPDIPGRESFAGPSWHSAAWQHQHDLKGKTVAVIGTGASALQIVPEVAKVAGRLKVFQRSAPWVFPNPQYHAAVSDGKEMAADACAILRAMVSLPAVLCQLRRFAAGAEDRPRMASSGPLDQRAQRPHPAEPGGEHQASGRRAIRRCWRR